MFYVYRLESEGTSKFGYTTDMKRRLAEHNRGEVVSTAKHAPYNLIFYTAYDSARTARNYEDYLKTGSGKAFARKRLWPGS